MPSLPRPRFGLRTRVASEPVRPAEEPDGPQIEVIEANGLKWINATRVGPEEVAWLKDNFDFHELDLEDVLSRNQRPKVDVYDDYLFAVLHFPNYDKKIGRLSAAELDVFISNDFVITMPNQELRTINFLFDRAEHRDDEREKLFGSGTGYLLYRLIDECVDASFPMLRKIGNKLEQIEEEIFAGHSREIVRDISNVKQEIINFRRVVRPQRTALKDLNVSRRYLVENEELYFDDINDASERIWDMLENFKEVVDGLEDSNESVLSHQLNDTLRVLTVFSILMLPPTLLAGIFGMNTTVPGEGNWYGFAGAIGLMLVVIVAMVIWFRRRGFL